MHARCARSKEVAGSLTDTCFGAGMETCHSAGFILWLSDSFSLRRSHQLNLSEYHEVWVQMQRSQQFSFLKALDTREHGSYWLKNTCLPSQSSQQYNTIWDCEWVVICCNQVAMMQLLVWKRLCESHVLTFWRSQELTLLNNIWYRLNLFANNRHIHHCRMLTLD